VGGIREKVVAAHRAGIKTFLLPRQNLKDLEEVPEDAKHELTFVQVDRMDEVLPVALHTSTAELKAV
jgi:ATP-dependent Lon protease